MKLLIIGGSRFLGRHLVAASLAGDHEVTLFNRGQQSWTNLPAVETIYGDRNTDLAKLKGRLWDTVIDTCGYLPRNVRSAAQVLSKAVDRYVFISSLSVYADVSVIGVDEAAPLKKLTTEQVAKANAIDTSGQSSAFTYGEMYGGLKALCEEAVEEVMPNRVLTIRPGLIVGPYDYTDRFTYWVVRIARGGEVLAPGRPDRNVQFIDARDLAEWTLRMIEAQQIGIYNANGLPNHVTMENYLADCKVVTNSDSSFTWVSEDFLKQEGVAAWSELPLWLPESEPRFAGFMSINCDKAIAAGLSYRPLSQTVNDTLNWYQTERLGDELKAGMTSDRQRLLLGKWKTT